MIAGKSWQIGVWACLKCAIHIYWPQRRWLIRSRPSCASQSSTHPKLTLVNLEGINCIVHLIISFFTVELFVMHLSPKSQRIHRNNRRGNILKTRQKANPSLKASDESKSVTSFSNKRASSNETTSGTPSKRPKISWP